ncbi:integral membrane [Pyrenophora seminiperda CCB06]|uniref:Integral membrane n=1 Tax=Pyrenophora seminiperda CCB06 TaxID=1302712 RepID=A0A3M7M518_9PLEO|nr:integral membrane [Pyrenophora seminiperda CCB06]
MPGQQPRSNLILFGGIEVDISQLDFNDHTSNVAAIKISCIIFIALVIPVVALRIFSRLKCGHRIFTDDVLIMFATGFTVSLAVMCIAATRYGLGEHIWLIPMGSVFETMKGCILYLFICQILYAFAIAFTKLSIISSYLRLFPDKRFRVWMYILAFLIVGLWVAGVFVTIFQCTPVRGAWDFTIEGRRCINYVTYLYASSAVNVATDIVLCILPLPHLWRLQLPLRERVVLCVLLAGGASACVVGSIRIALLERLRVLDTTYDSVPGLIMSVGECSLGIISVSFASLRPLAKRFFSARKSGSQPSIPLRKLRTHHNSTDTLPELLSEKGTGVSDGSSCTQSACKDSTDDCFRIYEVPTGSQANTEERRVNGLGNRDSLEAEWKRYSSPC